MPTFSQPATIWASLRPIFAGPNSSIPRARRLARAAHCQPHDRLAAQLFERHEHQRLDLQAAPVQIGEPPFDNGAGRGAQVRTGQLGRRPERRLESELGRLELIRQKERQVGRSWVRAKTRVARDRRKGVVIADGARLTQEPGADGAVEQHRLGR